MKLAASVSLMFRELPLLDRFDAARRAGFHGVEIQRLHEGDPAEMARAAQDAGVQVVLVNCGLADYLQGGPGLSGVPGRELEFRETFAETPYPPRAIPGSIGGLASPLSRHLSRQHPPRAHGECRHGGLAAH